MSLPPLSPESFSLTLEQELQLRNARDNFDKLSKEEAKDYFLQLMTQNMVKQNIIREMAKH